MSRRLLGAVVAVVAVIAVTIWGTARVAAQQDCSRPTVQALISAEAAVSRPVVASPAEYALSNVYSLIEQATKPQFTYAEAGPQYAGAFEALVPAGSPPPVRAVSAYPSEDIPDEDSEDWGGTSRTEVTSISTLAASSGAREVGAGGATSESSRSWATSIVECDVITVIAGWEASGVVLAPGVSAQQMGETLTLVVGPTGSSASTEVTLVGVEGAQEVPLEGRITDPFTDPIREGGGPRIEAGEPRAEANETGATASGGGFNFLLTDPSTGQGAGYRIGSINATIDVLGALSFDEPEVPVATEAPDPAPPEPPVPDAAGSTSPTASAVAGTPPPPSVGAIATTSTAFSDTVISSVDVTTRSWYWLFVTIATAMVLAGMGATAWMGRARFPTIVWIVGHGDRLAARFSAVYLKW